jgi:hypothetical protein
LVSVLTNDVCMSGSYPEEFGGAEPTNFSERNLTRI